MNDSTDHAQPSRLARASHRLGVLALLMLVLSGLCILGLADRVGGSRLQVLTPAEGILFSLGAVFCQGMAVVAAPAALILGILGLVEINRGAGKVDGRGLAVSGLVTATLTVLAFALVYGVGLLILIAN
jgi:hypothetical protein